MQARKFDVTMTVTERGRKAPKYTLDADRGGAVSLEDFMRWHKEVLMSVASDVLREEQMRGFPKQPMTVVDGRKDKPLATVLPFGKIEFVAAVASAPVLVSIFEGLLQRSKVVSGYYINHHLVVFNGITIASNIQQLKAWAANPPAMKKGDTIVFVNTAPYARKLERYGVTAQRSQMRQVDSKDKNNSRRLSRPGGGKVLAPNGVYFLTFRSIRRKFKNNALIQFRLISGSDMGLNDRFSEAGKYGKPDKATGKSRNYLYPSIRITIGEEGML